MYLRVLMIVFKDYIPIFYKLNSSIDNFTFDSYLSYTEIITNTDVKTLKSLIGNDYINDYNRDNELRFFNVSSCHLYKEILKELYFQTLSKNLSFENQLDNFNDLFNFNNLELYKVKKIIEINERLKTITDEREKQTYIEFKDFLLNFTKDFRRYFIKSKSLFIPVLYIAKSQFLKCNFRIFVYPFQKYKSEYIVELFKKSQFINLEKYTIEYFDIKSSILRTILYIEYKNRKDTNNNKKFEHYIYDLDKDLYLELYKHTLRFLEYLLSVEKIISPQQYEKLIYILEKHLNIETRREYFKREISSFLNCAKSVKNHKFLELVHLLSKFISENKKKLNLNKYIYQIDKDFSLFPMVLKYYLKNCVIENENNKDLRISKLTNYQIYLNFKELFLNRHLKGEFEHSKFLILHYNLDGFIYVRKEN